MFDFNGQRQNPPFPRRLLRLLSMGCGISKFDPKEVVEAAACPHINPPTTCANRTSNCFAGESKPLIGELGGTNTCSSSEEQSRKGDSSRSAGLLKEEAAAEKMKVNNVKRGDTEEKDDGAGTETGARRRNAVKEEPESTEFGDCSDDDEEDGNEQNHRGICRGGSPSFREYCVDFDSRSRSIKSVDNCDGVDHCKWPNQHALNPEKRSESQTEKKEGRGKSFMNALHRGKSGGVRNLLSASRRHHPNFPSSHHHHHHHHHAHDTSQKLLAKAS